jgi:hypothetical protein
MANESLDRATSLPRSPSQCDIINIKCKGLGSTSYRYTVDREKILAALKWLCEHHPSYFAYREQFTHECAVDLANLDAWDTEEPVLHVVHQEAPATSVPFECSEDDDEVTKVPEASDEAGANMPKEGVDDDPDLDDHIKEILLDMGDQPEDSVKSLCRELNIKFGTKSKEDFPEHLGVVNIKDIDDYWEASFPHLFPYGRGGPKDHHRVGGPMTDDQWDLHAFKEKSHRFAQNIPFLFSRHLYRMKRSASQIAYVTDRFSKFQPNHTLSDVREAARYGEFGLEREKIRQESEEILKRLTKF